MPRALKKNYGSLELVLCRSIPSRFVRSVRHDSSRTQVYAYIAVNDSSLRKKTATADRRYDLFGMLHVRQNRCRHAKSGSK